MKDLAFWEDALNKALKKVNKLDKKVIKLDKRTIKLYRSKVKLEKRNVKFFKHIRNNFAKKHKSIKENNIPYILNMIERLSKS